MCGKFNVIAKIFLIYGNNSQNINSKDSTKTVFELFASHHENISYMTVHTIKYISHVITYIRTYI